MSAPLSLDRLRQVSITVHDLARAEGFYRDVLGMTHLFSAPPKMAFFDCGGVRLMLAIPEKEELDHPSSILYFGVDDIDAAHAAMVDRGVEFESAPVAVHRDERHELWMAFFRDPDGNVLAVTAEKPVA